VRAPSCVRCQFVLEADEALFEAFAPQRLKNSMKKAAELERPALLGSFRGLDLQPVLKLCLVLAMIGAMVGLSIAPQARVLSAAADALCGK
jgi:hypothetical protein